MAVRDDLKQQDDDAVMRQWQLEYGDILLALNNWTGARKRYQPLLAVQQLKQRAHKPTAGEIESLFGQYLNSIEQVVQTVDRHLRSSSP